MSTKILLGFLAGAVAASVIYWVMDRRDDGAVQTAAAISTPAPVSTPAVSTPAVSTPAANPPAAVNPPAAAPAPVQIVKSTVRRKSAVKAAPSVEPKPVETKSEIPKPVETAPVTPPPAAAEQPKIPEPAVATPALPPPPPNKVTIAAGTLVAVRLQETLSSKDHKEGDVFSAVLDQPLVIDGFVIAERGSKAEGRVVQSTESGRVKGLASLTIELTRITTADGQKVAVKTAHFERKAEQTKGEDAVKAGTMTAIGAAIGAIAGGGKGAAIGAGAGGAAGAGTVLMTRGKHAVLPVETRLSFRIEAPVTVTERTKSSSR